MLIISDISCLLGIYHRYLSPYSNHSNENGYKKGCPRALVTYIFVFSHSQKYNQPFSFIQQFV